MLHKISELRGYRILATDASAVWRHGPTEGQPRFRAAIAARFGGEADHVLVIAGAQEILSEEMKEQ